MGKRFKDVFLYFLKISTFRSVCKKNTVTTDKQNKLTLFAVKGCSKFNTLIKKKKMQQLLTAHTLIQRIHHRQHLSPKKRRCHPKESVHPSASPPLESHYASP